MTAPYLEWLFGAGSIAVFPFWLLMIFAPRWSGTVRTITSPLVIAGPVALYALLALPIITVILPVLVRPSVASIATLLGSPAGATLGWLHFLAFDLFVGRWIYLESRARAIPALIVSPILVLTLLLGPLGFLVYACVRSAFRTDITPGVAQ